MTTAAPPAVHVATQYAIDVTRGAIIAGPWVRLACERHMRDLALAGDADFPYVFSPERADKALNFFKYARLYEGATAGQPFKLLEFQQFIVGSIFGWIHRDTGMRRFQTAYVETAKGSGKALALDTPIPTPTGWTTMGAIAPGDWVFDEAGQPTRVIAATEPMHGHDCYRVKFSDETSVVADADHLWKTHRLHSLNKDRGLGRRGVPKSEWRRVPRTAVRTTREIAATLSARESSSLHPQAKWNHRIDNGGPLILPEVDLPVPPYTFGVWLGDGDSDAARITVGAQDKAEMLAAIRADGTPTSDRHGNSNGASRVLLGDGDRTQAARNRSVQARLRDLGVLFSKHIPKSYLRGSYRQRMDLLQGLMDTDGTISVAGEAAYTTTSRRLATDVCELVRSLGFKTRITEGVARLRGVYVSPKFNIMFTPYADVPVFRLNRKLARQKQRPSTRPLSTGRMVIGCEPVPSVPVKCITVANETGMFLAGDGMVPTHNSPLAGVIGLYMLMADGEEGAQVYYAASKFDQALLAFRYGHTFAESSPQLAKRLIIDKQNLAFPKTNSFMRPIASRVRGQSGPLPHCVIADEIHEMDDPEVLNLLRRGVKSRQQPLIFEITNAGQGQEGIAWEHHEYSIKVLRGVVDDEQWFGYLCALDDGDQWTDPAVWIKANPGLGTILPVEYVAKQVQEGREILTAQNNVKRLNLCIWTAAKTAWLDMDKFDRGRVTADEFARIVEREGQRAYMGVDLSSTVAMTAVATGWRLPPIAPAAEAPEEVAAERAELARVAVRVHFFLPEEGLQEREQRDSVPYTAWADAGYITLTPGNVVDYAFIRRYVTDEAAENDVESIGFDPWNARDTLTTLQSQGLPVAEVPQSFSMLSDPCKQLERMVAANWLLWEDNPVLRWHAMNATTRRDPNGNILPDRSGERTRIDGISALVTMLALLVRDPVEPEPDFEITYIEFD